MKRLLASLALATALVPRPATAQDKPSTVAYYYRVRWGFQEEFERLFLKNHYPVLAAEKKAGHMSDVHLFKPTFHGDGRADWTYLVVITYPKWEAVGTTPPDRDATLKRLYPDQETFKKEEARRFEILEAHWDIPLTSVPPPQ